MYMRGRGVETVQHHGVVVVDIRLRCFGKGRHLCLLVSSSFSVDQLWTPYSLPGNRFQLSILLIVPYKYLKSYLFLLLEFLA